ncbi:MAG: hypothetical protein ACI9DC_003998 [Gammaproteobacteria bacterium]
MHVTGRDQSPAGEQTADTTHQPCLDDSAAQNPNDDPCLRESLRLEANKLAATRMLQMFDNPVLALREYNRFVRDLNISINVHNAVCKPYPVRPV